MRLEKILFPTDFSETADHAFKQAVALAIAHQAKLHVFHSILLHSEDPRHLQTVLKGYAEHVEKEALDLLQKASGGLEGKGLQVEFSTSRAFSPYEAIAEKVDQFAPDLIVMGTHGRGGVGKLLLGDDPGD